MKSKSDSCGNQPPKTIAELKEWYKSRNLPPENETRFFIGKDIGEPRAFGIYEDRDTGEFVVYKNKGNGERAIRYRGWDEAYAVNELYLKLKSEIVNQKRLLRKNDRPSAETDQDEAMRKVKTVIKNIGIMLGCLCMFVILSLFPDLVSALFGSFFLTLIVLVVWSVIFNGTAFELKSIGQIVGIYCAFAIIIFVFSYSNNKTTYYKYDGRIYCHSHGDYYGYDDSCGDYWFIGDGDMLPEELLMNLEDYEWDEPEDSWYFTEFEDSNYYEENFASSSDDSDWDSDFDYDWDSGDSWDSGGMDWDSDW